MRVYLVQHGHALAKDVDPQRPLSDRGRADVEQIASFLAGAGTRVSRILHSGKKRAEETADRLSTAVCPGNAPEKISGIDPADPVDAFAGTLGRYKEDTMIVGHLPFLDRLVSYLLTRDESIRTVAFVPGTVVCLELREDGHWSITGMVGPGLLRESKP